jgi:hypothetical protein
MIPFQLHRRIPLLRRPFFQRDQAIAERDRVRAERDSLAARPIGAFDNDFVWLLSHKPAAPALPLAVSQATAVPPDDSLVARTIAAYRKADRAYEKSSSGWDQDISQINLAIHDKLLNGTRPDVAKLLRNPAETTLFWGFDAIAKAPPGAVEPHELVLRRLDAATPWTMLYAIWIMDALRSLAEAVGAVRVAYPEVDRKAETVAEILKTADPILQQISSALGFQVDFPNPFAGEAGVPSNRGIIGFRAVQAIYQAWRILCLSRGNPDVRVLEIGAGLGRTAYYATRMGIRNYTIVDIPLTNAAQAYFLGRTLGYNAISLFDENETGVRIMPPPGFLQGDDRYDLVFNADSMTETTAQAARAYCEAIKARADLFLSINHEFNPVTVRDLCAGQGMTSIIRSPYWMRRGYVEEIFPTEPLVS